MVQEKEYICPMHPQIRQNKPGSCPICGMALEEKIEAGASTELKDMSRRFWIAVPLTFLLMVFPQISPYFQFLLCSPVVLWCGWPFLERGWVSIKNRKLNMFTLIGLGVTTAFLYSLFATFLPFLFPDSLKMENGHPSNYFEAASAITTLVLLGQVLELRAREKTGSAIKALLSLVPKQATLILDDQTEKTIPLEDIQIKDKLRVKPGEQIPVDGVILQGSSSIDESMMTGESMPVEKKPGDLVAAGTLNENGTFIMLAEKIGKDTLLSRIIHMVSEAQRSRAPIQQLADTVSSYFVPIVVIIAILTFIAWSLFGPSPSFVYGLVNAVAVLIIACPCALGLATPMSIMVGVGRGAKAGILIKNAGALEQLSKVDTLVIDKTGTLTEGKVRLISIIPQKGQQEEEILRLAASVEIASEHPLSRAIVRAASERKLNLLPASEFKAHRGKGITGVVEGKKIAIGTSLFLLELGMQISSFDAEKLEGQTVIYLAVNNEIAGLFGLSDKIKDTSLEAVNLLHEEKIKIIMLTGDNKTTAEAVGKKLGIDEIHSQVLPDQKIKQIEELQKKGHVVAMAGDGTNDAPALAQADVGIAMGTGTDVAIESAGISLIKGDLRSIAKALKLSRGTMRNIKQNLWLAFLYNTIAVPIAAGILYPFFGILLSPVIASAAMALSSVSVIANALRLRRIRL